MKYGLTILTDERAEQEIAYLFKDKHYQLEYDGYKRLSYSIRECEYAHYYYLTLGLSEFETSLLSKELENKDWCLRYLLVKAANEKHRLIYNTIKAWADRQLGIDALTHEQIELLTDKLEKELGE